MQRRRLGDHRAVALVLAVEDAQGVALEPREAVRATAAPAALEIAHQHLAVGVPAGRVAQRVQLEDGLRRHAERLEDVGAQGDDLDIGHRLARPRQLDADLVELALAALLRPLVAEHRARRRRASAAGPGSGRRVIRARTTPAVFSGRSVIRSPPRSSKVYISLVTTSEVSPSVRWKTSVNSKIGVAISP